MQTSNIRDFIHLYRREVSLFGLALILVMQPAFGQLRFNSISTAGQDDRAISYGFFLAGHTNMYRLKYSDAYVNQNGGFARTQSIMPVYTPGFSLGFLAVFRLHDQVNVMVTPKIGFYEFKTDVHYLDESINTVGRDRSFVDGVLYRRVVSEETMIELPILFKYKAQRFNNNRMFFTAGGSAMFRTKDQEEADLDPIVTTGTDFTVDMGMGFDMYFKYFKFSPEIRFSHGLMNIYRPSATDPIFRDAISEIRRRSITLYLNFQ